VQSAEFKVRLLSTKIFGSAGALPSKTTCHLLLAIRYLPFTIRQSRIAAVQPVANRQSLLAAVLAQQEPRPPDLSTD